MEISKNIYSSVFIFIKYFSMKYWLFISIISISVILWAFNEVLFPYLIKNLVDAFSDNKTIYFSQISTTVFLLAGIWILMEIVSRIYMMLSIYISPRLQADIRKHLYTHILKQSYASVNDVAVGELSDTISQLPKNCERILSIVLINTSSISVSLIFSILILTTINLYYSVALLLAIVVNVLVTIFTYSHIRDANADYNQARSSLVGDIVDTLENFYIVKVFSATNYENMNFIKRQEREKIMGSMALWKIEKINSIRSVILLTFISLIISGLIYQKLNQQVTIGSFILVIMISFTMMGQSLRFNNLMIQLFDLIGNVKSGLLFFNKYFMNSFYLTAKMPALKINNGSVEFKEVIFNYDNSKNFYMNFKIPSGTWVGVIGLSGSGKTTLTKLLMAQYHPQSGSIFIDGQNIANVTPESINENISIVNQNPILFNRSILENIIYGKLDATFEEVIFVAKQVGIHDFISLLPEAYATNVGQLGNKLSGGQRQRVALARAILKKAPIIILDEVTTSLDPVNANHIIKLLKKTLANSTVIMISHNLKQISLYTDRIIFFNNKKTLTEGKLSELIKIDNSIKEFYDLS